MTNNKCFHAVNFNANYFSFVFPFLGCIKSIFNTEILTEVLKLKLRS